MLKPKHLYETNLYQDFHLSSKTSLWLNLKIHSILFFFIITYYNRVVIYWDKAMLYISGKQSYRVTSTNFIKYLTKKKYNELPTLFEQTQYFPLKFFFLKVLIYILLILKNACVNCSFNLSKLSSFNVLTVIGGSNS